MASEETIHIDDFDIELVRRPHTRRLSLRIQSSGKMRLTAANGTPLRTIKAFLLENLDWLKRTETRFKKIRDDHPIKKFLEGEKFCFLGEYFKLAFQTGEKVSLNVDRDRHVMVMSVPPHLNAQDVAKSYIRDFYSHVGRKYISSRIDAISEMMKLKPLNVSFRSQKTRWGSCSSKGNVTFNWRLAIAPPTVIDYVIVHELAHLKHMNHSAKFWNLVEKYSPDHKKLKTWLNKHRYEADFLAEKSELHELEDDLDERE